MENKLNSKEECCCGKDCRCCTPTYSWKKWIFIAIILATAAIVTMKIAGKDRTIVEKCCHKHENSSCCPQTKVDNDENSSCCPHHKSDNDD